MPAGPLRLPLQWLLVLLVFDSGTHAAAAEQARAPAAMPTPWTAPDVLQAAANIGLTEQQQPRFRDAVREFVRNLAKDQHRVLTGIDQRDQPRRLELARAARARDMDAQVAGFLTAEQLPRYETYRDLLLDRMVRRRAPRRR